MSARKKPDAYPSPRLPGATQSLFRLSRGSEPGRPNVSTILPRLRCGRVSRRALYQNVLMPTHTALRVFALAVLLTCWPRTGTCEARLPGILSSHMVLQRDKPIHIWGWSEPGEKVSVTFHGISRDAAGDSLGNWSVFLAPEACRRPVPAHRDRHKQDRSERCAGRRRLVRVGPVEHGDSFERLPRRPPEELRRRRSPTPASRKSACFTSPTRPRTFPCGTPAHPGLSALPKQRPTSPRWPTSSDAN